jgi:hypothetical protein
LPFPLSLISIVSVIVVHDAKVNLQPNHHGAVCLTAPSGFSCLIKSAAECSWDLTRLGLGEVVAVVVHDFVPGVSEGVGEVRGGVGGGVAFGDAAELGVGAEDEVDAGGGPF